MAKRDALARQPETGETQEVLETSFQKRPERLEAAPDVPSIGDVREITRLDGTPTTETLLAVDSETGERIYGRPGEVPHVLVRTAQEDALHERASEQIRLYSEMFDSSVESVIKAGLYEGEEADAVRAKLMDTKEQLLAQALATNNPEQTVVEALQTAARAEAIAKMSLEDVLNRILEVRHDMIIAYARGKEEDLKHLTVVEFQLDRLAYILRKALENESGDELPPHVADEMEGAVPFRGNARYAEGVDVIDTLIADEQARIEQATKEQNVPEFLRAQEAATQHKAAKPIVKKFVDLSDLRAKLQQVQAQKQAQTPAGKTRKLAADLKKLQAERAAEQARAEQEIKDRIAEEEKMVTLFEKTFGWEDAEKALMEDSKPDLASAAESLIQLLEQEAARREVPQNPEQQETLDETSQKYQELVLALRAFGLEPIDEGLSPSLKAFKKLSARKQATEAKKIHELHALYGANQFAKEVELAQEKPEEPLNFDKLRNKYDSIRRAMEQQIINPDVSVTDLGLPRTFEEIENASKEEQDELLGKLAELYQEYVVEKVSDVGTRSERAKARGRGEQKIGARREKEEGEFEESPELGGMDEWESGDKYIDDVTGFEDEEVEIEEEEHVTFTPEQKKEYADLFDANVFIEGDSLEAWEQTYTDLLFAMKAKGIDPFEREQLPETFEEALQTSKKRNWKKFWKPAPRVQLFRRIQQLSNTYVTPKVADLRRRSERQKTRAKEQAQTVSRIGSGTKTGG